MHRTFGRCLTRMLLCPLMLGSLMLTLNAWAHQTQDECELWPELPNVMRTELHSCVEPPVARKIGQVCVRHEWLCGDGDFGGWFARWAREVDAPMRLELLENQLIFSAEDKDQAWAIFMAASPQATEGFTLLLSRMRPEVAHR
jgi:hypothetical protein